MGKSKSLDGRNFDKFLDTNEVLRGRERGEANILNKLITMETEGVSASDPTGKLFLKVTKARTKGNEGGDMIRETRERVAKGPVQINGGFHIKNK